VLFLIRLIQLPSWHALIQRAQYSMCGCLVMQGCVYWNTKVPFQVGSDCYMHVNCCWHTIWRYSKDLLPYLQSPHQTLCCRWSDLTLKDHRHTTWSRMTWSRMTLSRMTSRTCLRAVWTEQTLLPLQMTHARHWSNEHNQDAGYQSSQLCTLLYIKACNYPIFELQA